MGFNSRILAGGKEARRDVGNRRSLPSLVNFPGGSWINNCAWHQREIWACIWMHSHGLVIANMVREEQRARDAILEPLWHVRDWTWKKIQRRQEANSRRGGRESGEWGSRKLGKSVSRELWPAASQAARNSGKCLWEEQFVGSSGIEWGCCE